VVSSSLFFLAWLWSAFIHKRNTKFSQIYRTETISTALIVWLFWYFIRYSSMIACGKQPNICDLRVIYEKSLWHGSNSREIHSSIRLFTKCIILKGLCDNRPQKQVKLDGFWVNHWSYFITVGNQRFKSSITSSFSNLDLIS